MKNASPKGHQGTDQLLSTDGSLSCESGLTYDEIDMLCSPTESLNFDFSAADFVLNSGLMSNGLMSNGLMSNGSFVGLGFNHSSNNNSLRMEGESKKESVPFEGGGSDKWINAFDFDTDNFRDKHEEEDTISSPASSGKKSGSEKKKKKNKKPPSVFRFDGFSSGSGTDDGCFDGLDDGPISKADETLSEKMKRIVAEVVSAEMDKRGYDSKSPDDRESLSIAVRNNLNEMDLTSKLADKSPYSMPPVHPKSTSSNANSSSSKNQISAIDVEIDGTEFDSDNGFENLDYKKIMDGIDISALEMLSIENMMELNSDNDSKGFLGTANRATKLKGLDDKVKIKKERKPATKKVAGISMTEEVEVGEDGAVIQKAAPKSRTSNSLSALAVRFVTYYGNENTIKYISAQLNEGDPEEIQGLSDRVDGAAEALNVHVRRIYELIKILEILSLVTFSGEKRGKFTWKGTKHFVRSLGSIQAEGMLKYPQIAENTGLRQIQAMPSPLPLHVEQPAVMNHMDNSMTGQPFGSESPMSEMANASPVLSVAPHPAYTNTSNVSSAASIASTVSSGPSTAVPHHDRHDRSSPFKAGTMDASLVEATQITSIWGNSITPSQKLLPDGSATKKRSKEATPRKVTKIKGEGEGRGKEAGPSDQPDHMLENMCRNFMMLFLVGMDAISMSYAVHSLIPIGENETTEEYNKKYATKIRRVYDVANVLCSLNILQKTYVPRPVDAEIRSKKELKTDVKVLVWASFKPVQVRQAYVETLRQRARERRL